MLTSKELLGLVGNGNWNKKFRSLFNYKTPGLDNQSKTYLIQTGVMAYKFLKTLSSLNTPKQGSKSVTAELELGNDVSRP